MYCRVSDRIRITADNPDFCIAETLCKVERKRFRRLKKKQQGKNTSLNIGISLASEDIVFSTDADLVWDEYSAERLVRGLLSDERNAAGTGDLQPNPGVDRVTSMEKPTGHFSAEWRSGKLRMTQRMLLTVVF